MHAWISDIIYYCEPFDRYHAYLDIVKLSEISGGYVRTPERQLASRWMWSLGKVRRFIQDLVDHGVLEQCKVGRNNELRLPSEDLISMPYVEKERKADEFKREVCELAEGVDIAVINQYCEYWLAWDNRTKTFKYERFQGFTIDETLAYWIAKSKQISNNKNTNHNGNNTQHAAPCSSESDESEAITLEDIKRATA